MGRGTALQRSTVWRCEMDRSLGKRNEWTNKTKKCIHCTYDDFFTQNIKHIEFELKILSAFKLEI